MRTKSIALLSVFLMLASGFTVLAVVGDNTDTSSAVRDYTGRTTLDISWFATGGDETFNVTYGTYLDLTEVFDELDGYPAGIVVIDSGNANQFGITGAGNEVIKGYLNRIGSFTFRVNDYNELEGYSIYYYCTVNVLPNETITWAKGQTVSDAVEIRSTPAEIDSSMIEFRNSSWNTTSVYSGVTVSTIYEPDQDLNVIEFGGQMNANVLAPTTVYMVIPSERYAVALVATPFGTAEYPLGDVSRVAFGREYYVAKGSKLTFINESEEVGELDDGEEFTDWEIGTIPSPKTSVSGGYQWTADTVGDYTVNFGRYLHCFDPQSEEFYEEPQGSGTTVIHVVNCSYTHTVNYAANGGSGTMNAKVVEDTNNGNSAVTLDACSFTRSGYHFSGWKIGNTVYQPGQTVSVGPDASVTATAQWARNTLSIGSVSTVELVVNKGDSFVASASSDPSGASVTYSVSNVDSGLSVSVVGNRIVCNSATAGTYHFTLTASASGYSSSSTTVTVVAVPVLVFLNSPAAGALNS